MAMLSLLQSSDTSDSDCEGLGLILADSCIRSAADQVDQKKVQNQHPCCCAITIIVN